MADGSKLVKKAAVAAALVGGGIALTSGQAGAAETPSPPAPPANPFEEWGQQLLVEYGPKVAAFIESLRPVDDPTTAEVTAGPTGATGTGYSSPESPWVFGQTEATPNGARVTVLRHGDKDLLTKEGDANGGTWGGEWAGLGKAIDWVNERTCPSGGHGGEDLCITFFEAKATVDEAEVGEPVEVTRSTHSLIDGQRFSSSNSTDAFIKGLLKRTIPNDQITLSGTASGNSVQNDAEFSLFKASKGGDSFSLLPSSARYTRIEIEDAKLTTPELPIKIGGTTYVIKPIQIDVPGSTACASESHAATVGGSGIFEEIADFLGTPKDGIWGDLGLSGGNATPCELPTSGN